jgi:hypothetical protein
METELDSFSPRHAVVLTTTGASIPWSSFVVGANAVKRITLNEYGQVAVYFESGLIVRLVGMTDSTGVERVNVAPLADPVHDARVAAVLSNAQQRQVVQKGQRR